MQTSQLESNNIRNTLTRVDLFPLGVSFYMLTRDPRAWGWEFCGNLGSDWRRWWRADYGLVTLNRLTVRHGDQRKGNRQGSKEGLGGKWLAVFLAVWPTHAGEKGVFHLEFMLFYCMANTRQVSPSVRGTRVFQPKKIELSVSPMCAGRKRLI